MGDLDLEDMISWQMVVKRMERKRGKSEDMKTDKGKFSSGWGGEKETGKGEMQ